MTEHQSDGSLNSGIDKFNTKSFANFWFGTFFLVSSLSLLVLMGMFLFIWQPIWTEGFKDFHTISNAIDKLDKTAKPASEAIPLMLGQMSQINQHMYQMNTTMQELERMSKTMHDMQATMHEMYGSLHGMSVSVGNIEQMTPEIQRMSVVLSTEMPRLNWSIGRVNNKMPNMDFMPFN